MTAGLFCCAKIATSTIAIEFNIRTLGTNHTSQRWSRADGGVSREHIMRLGIFLGVILGILLTVGSAFTYDTVSGRAATAAASSSADDPRPMVNWDVVGRDFSDLRASLIDVGNRVQSEWRKLRT